MRATIALACLLCASSAAADDATPYVRLALGGGRMRARNHAAPESGSVVDAMARGALGFEISAGASLRSEVFAARYLEEIVTVDLSGSSRSVGLTWAFLGVGWEHRFARRGGPWVGAGLGYCSFALRTSGSYDSEPSGFALLADGGWDVPLSDRSSFGLVARLMYARMHSSSYGGSLYEAFSPTLLASFTWR